MVRFIGCDEFYINTHCLGQLHQEWKKMAVMVIGRR